MDTDFFTLLEQGKFEEAHAWVKFRPQVPDWKRYAYTAAIHQSLKEYSECEEALNRALVSPDPEWIAYYLQAKFLIARSRAREALSPAEIAFSKSGGRYDCFTLYLHCLLDQSRAKDVLTLCNKLEAKFADNLEVLLARASAYRSLRMDVQALECIARVKKLHPTNNTVHRIHADLVGESDSRKAVALYREAFARETRSQGSADPATRWNSSLHFLRVRDFEEGWSNWSLGFDKAVGTLGRSVPTQLASEIRVGDFDSIDPDRWILVVPEQGLGDQILFLSDFDRLRAESDRLMLVCDPRMHSILLRSFPNAIVGQPGLIDVWPELSIPRLGFLPYGSIMSRFRRTREAFYSPMKLPYLKPDFNKVAKYREQLQEHAQGKPIVGISWRGGHWQQQQANKSVVFTDWLDLLKAGESLFISLQYGSVSKERALAKEHGLNIKFIEGINFVQDLDDWFALACATDFIFSVSTALIHFTGAAGHRTHIVMPDMQGPWVLGIDDVSHPIYKETTIARRKVSTPMGRFLVEAFEQVIGERNDEATILQR